MSLNLSKEEILSFFKNEGKCFQLLNNQFPNIKLLLIGHDEEQLQAEIEVMQKENIIFLDLRMFHKNYFKLLMCFVCQVIEKVLEQV